MRDPTRSSARNALARRAAAALLSLTLAACLKVASPSASAATGPLKESPDGRALQLTFADEFNSFHRWDGAKGVWRTRFRDGADPNPFALRTLFGNKERQLYVDPDLPLRGRPLNPFVVHDGRLDIVAEPAPAAVADQLHGFRYISGLITTQPSFSQTYGYFEMRAKLPLGKGIWPAFWLLPADQSWPPEIDVMECIGVPEVYATAHSRAMAQVPTTKVQIDPDAYHTFAVSWDPKELIWFLDGRETKRQPTPPDMNKPMFMLANVAVGGAWPGDPDATTPFPARMSIDYIRAYRFAP